MELTKDESSSSLWKGDSWKVLFCIFYGVLGR